MKVNKKTRFYSKDGSITHKHKYPDDNKHEYDLRKNVMCGNRSQFFFISVSFSKHSANASPQSCARIYFIYKNILAMIRQILIFYEIRNCLYI